MRDTTIDIARGIGILTVVICHNWILYHDPGDFSNIIFSFHMPLFFFISGIFFKPELSFKDTLISKANSLLKPYVVVIIALILFDILKNLFQSNTFNATNALVKGLYSSTFTLDWVQLWFLSHLFAVYLFGWFLYQSLLKHVMHRLLNLLIISIIFFVGIQNIQLFWSKSFNPFGINTLINGSNPQFLGLPFNIDLLLVTTPIFLAGYFFSKQMLAFKFNAVLFWPSLIIFTFLHYQFNYTMGLHDRQYDQLIITSAQMVTGIYLVFGFSVLITKLEFLGKALAYLGSASLFILIFHYSLQHMFTGIFQYKFPQYNYSIAAIAFVTSILYSLIIYEIVNRYELLKSLFYDTSKNRASRGSP